jgi:hypothetical protein
MDGAGEGMKVALQTIGILFALMVLATAWGLAQSSALRRKLYLPLGTEYAMLQQKLGSDIQLNKMLEGDGSRQRIVVLELQDGWSYIPSGRPIYLFDGEDKLVDFTFDSGDDPGFLQQHKAVREALRDSRPSSQP